jgi:hypothetical protein
MTTPPRHAPSAGGSRFVPSQREHDHDQQQADRSRRGHIPSRCHSPGWKPADQSPLPKSLRNSVFACSKVLRRRAGKFLPARLM